MKLYPKFEQMKCFKEEWQCSNVAAQNVFDIWRTAWMNLNSMSEIKRERFMTRPFTLSLDYNIN